jgi:hypothetical protein
MDVEGRNLDTWKNMLQDQKSLKISPLWSIIYVTDMFILGRIARLAARLPA